MSDHTRTMNTGGQTSSSGSAANAPNTPPGVGPDSDEGLGSIMGNIVSDVVSLVRQETELAKEEMKHEASKASKAAAYFSVAGVGAHLAALFLTFALAFGMADWFDIDLAWTTLIVGVLWAIVAAVLFSRARSRMRSIDPVPRQTVQTLKEGL